MFPTEPPEIITPAEWLMTRAKKTGLLFVCDLFINVWCVLSRATRDYNELTLVLVIIMVYVILVIHYLMLVCVGFLKVSFKKVCLS